MATQKHTTNPTKIIAIPRGDVSIRLFRNARTRVIERFTVERFDPSSLAGLPPGSRIGIIATARYSEMTFDAGTIQARRTLNDIALSDIDKNYPLHLRIIVFNGETKKILASCERLSIYDIEEGGMKSLLPVEPADLGEQMWRLSAEEDGRPILQVNSDPDIGMMDKIANDLFCQSVVLPEAIRGALLHLRQSEEDPDDPDCWQSRWRRYLDDVGVALPDTDREEMDFSRIRLWADEAVWKISDRLGLKKAYRNSLGEGAA